MILHAAVVGAVARGQKRELSGVSARASRCGVEDATEPVVRWFFENEARVLGELMMEISMTRSATESTEGTEIESPVLCRKKLVNLWFEIASPLTA